MEVARIWKESIRSCFRFADFSLTFERLKGLPSFVKQRLARLPVPFGGTACTSEPIAAYNVTKSTILF